MPQADINGTKITISEELSAVLSDTEKLRKLEELLARFSSLEDLKTAADKSPSGKKRSHSSDGGSDSEHSVKSAKISQTPESGFSQEDPMNESNLSPGNPVVYRYSSASEVPTTLASTAREILMKFEIEQNSIKIIVNREQRPATNLKGGAQGDHVTAYAALLQLICNAIDGEDVHDAPEMLYKAAICFVDEKNFSFGSHFSSDKLQFQSKKEEITKQFFARDLRKELTASLRTILSSYTKIIENIDDPKLKRALQVFSSDSGDLKITADNINSLRDAIKRSNQTIFAQFAVAVGEQLIESYNKNPTVVFPKLSITDNKDTTEGNRVKMAIRNLRFLNKLIALTEGYKDGISADQQEDLLNDFKAACIAIMRSAIHNIGDSAINANFQSLLNDLNLIRSDQNILFNNINFADVEQIKNRITNINVAKIGEWFNDLFDFKCSGIKEDEDLDPTHITKSEGKIALRFPLDTLFKVTARHEDLMFIAFKNLNNLDQTLQDGVINTFREKVLSEEKTLTNKHNGQGWRAWKGKELISTDLLSLEPMTIDKLNDGVNKCKQQFKQASNSTKPSL